MAGDVDMAQDNNQRLWLLEKCMQYALLSEKKIPIRRGNNRRIVMVASSFLTLSGKPLCCPLASCVPLSLKNSFAQLLHTPLIPAPFTPFLSLSIPRIVFPEHFIALNED